MGTILVITHRYRSFVGLKGHGDSVWPIGEETPVRSTALCFCGHVGFNVLLKEVQAERPDLG